MKDYTTGGAAGTQESSFPSCPPAPPPRPLRPIHLAIASTLHEAAGKTSAKEQDYGLVENSDHLLLFTAADYN